jgi:Leucine-rich repeat (LRR) protein
MVELDLSHNNISQIKPETFAGNERLQTLTLAHNFITQIAPYQFPPLKHLVRTFVRSFVGG